jgi:hypothetical protein
MSKAVMQQALEALDRLSKLGNGDRDGNSEGNVIAQEARNKLRAELEKPEPEPIAWAALHDDGSAHIFQQKETAEIFGEVIPLYRREICNPAKALEDAKETIKDQQAEIERLQAALEPSSITPDAYAQI